MKSSNLGFKNYRKNIKTHLQLLSKTTFLPQPLKDSQCIKQAAQDPKLQIMISLSRKFKIEMYRPERQSQVNRQKLLTKIKRRSSKTKTTKRQSRCTKLGTNKRNKMIWISTTKRFLQRDQNISATITTQMMITSLHSRSKTKRMRIT